MAAYSLATAALALGINRKRLENLLARCDLTGTRPGRQGQARRLPREALIRAAAILQLEREFSMPTTAATELVRSARKLSDSGLVQLRHGPVTLAIDFTVIESALLAQLTDALEMAPRPRRGRPRREATRSAQLESK